MFQTLTTQVTLPYHQRLHQPVTAEFINRRNDLFLPERKLMFQRGRNQCHKNDLVIEKNLRGIFRYQFTHNLRPAVLHRKLRNFHIQFLLFKELADGIAELYQIAFFHAEGLALR